MTESLPQQQQTTQGKEKFLQCVRESGLVSADRLQRAVGQMPATDRSRQIARGLIEQGLLTKFQAERLLVGRTDGFVMGQYRILDELGRGGMGRVFKAEHMTMGRVVALKILNSNLVKTERARQLFHREVKAAAKLSHPNIVTAFDANQIGERCFLVMEFVDGPNLHDLVKEHGPLPVTQACDYIRQVALGLQYAHDIGMVHRDIKPANLLVQKTKTKAGVGSSIVKILDFGLARISTSEDGTPESDSIETNMKTVMGTPDYLSPEQARSLHDLDGRADLYSLGCTLYYLLTGNVPFKGGTTMEKLVRHSTEDAAPLNTLRADVPIEVAIIVQKMMAKKPDDRYQHGADLAAALLPFSGQESTNWIAVEPLPHETIQPVSSKYAPRIDANADPFSNLGGEPEEWDSPQAGTLSGEGALTSMSSLNNSKYRTKAKKADLGWLWASVGLMALLGALVGLYFLVRPLIK